MKTIRLLGVAALLAGCAANAGPDPKSEVELPSIEPTARILLVGDIMTGRGVATPLANDPADVFAGVRHLIAGADFAAGNLESPLTTAPQVGANENELEADPATAMALAAAGFDLMAIPNNHSSDAGPIGLLDTLRAVDGAGMQSVGAGSDSAQAFSPTLAVIGEDVTIGFLAYDATGVGTTAVADMPGIATWDETVATNAVRTLREQADIVVVSVHGGAEYLPTADPGMSEIGATLAAAGADVVWGHGAHVTQPVTVVDGPRPAVVATSLGNFLFDQAGVDRTTGHLLEVMVDRHGVVAYRVGLAEHPQRRVEFVEWLDPIGDSGWVDGSWWSLTRPLPATPGTTTVVDDFRHGDLVAAASGDINGDGAPDVVASFRRPHRMTPFMETHPEVQWADAQGRDAHLGVYRPDGLVEQWVAGSVLLPIAALEVCDGSLAVVHDQLDDPTVTAGGAWAWNGFGFDTAPDIPGGGTPACTDINGDGQTDPVILNR
jgi:poly-gamma-glutamate synthesis protein (capsule biosynthesis protein)